MGWWGAQQRKSEVHRPGLLEGGGGSGTTRSQKDAAFCGKGWLRQVDKYFPEDWMRVATSKTKIPRGQYIINNLKTWPLVIVSKGAGESCLPKPKQRVPVLISPSWPFSRSWEPPLLLARERRGYSVIFLWFYISALPNLSL